MKFLYFLVILSTTSIINYSQTITSTTQGGNWNNTTTWVGGVVPTAANDVVIAGNVEAGTNTCNNLTVNSGGTLQDECCAGRTLTVNGNLLNNGTIKTTYGGLIVGVKGNVVNNSVISCSGLELIGTGSQNISGQPNFLLAVL